MARRRGFGEVERRVSASGVVTNRARYAMPDGTRYSRTLATRMDAEAWLVAERALIDRDEWTPPQVRRAAEEKRKREAAFNTVEGFADRYLVERSLRPTTARGYRKLLANRILPYFGAMPLTDVTLSEIKRWRASLDPSTEATNAATFDELAIIVEQVPDRLKLFIVLAAYVGLREGELLELRRSDIDGITGRIDVTRKIDKDADPNVPGACPNCGRHISSPKTRSGTRTVHVPPPFLPILQAHLLEYTAPGEHGLLFPGDRTDHVSVRYLMDRYRPAREAAGRPDLTIHHLRHTALTLAGQHGATAAELQTRAGHASQAAMAIYQHATLDRDKALAEKIGRTYTDWQSARDSK
jgi:integrase